jgi:flagellar FliL protein
MTAALTRDADPGAEASKDDTKGAKGKGKGKDKDGKKKSFFKSKKFIIILVLLLAGGGAYKFLLSPSKPTPPAPGDVVAMDPTTLNLRGGHYLQVQVAIELVKGAADPTTFQTSKAAELVIDEFSNRTVPSLSTNKARKKLTAELATEIKHAYPKEVYAVFLTKFVTQ